MGSKVSISLVIVVVVEDYWYQCFVSGACMLIAKAAKEMQRWGFLVDSVQDCLVVRVHKIHRFLWEYSCNAY